MITFIIPTRNNLPYLKLAYNSIRKYYPDEEIIILDDNSTDGTEKWARLEENRDKNTIFYKNDGKQVGHTVLYDKGVELSDNEIFTIFHADMVCGPGYIENMMKHLKPQGIVAATRIEPPLHPPGKEKIIQNFGIYPEEFKENDFINFCHNCQNKNEYKNVTTRGIFAPWMMYKNDFLVIGGHDKFFAPFPYEDSDIFQRFILNGYDICQSRDSFVYHFTCRGHRWTQQVKKDDLFYTLCSAKNMAHFIRKWGNWIQNDENCFPIIYHKYDIGFVVKNCNQKILEMVEPWCSTIYCDADIKSYIDMVQPGTPYDMKQRVKPISILEKENYPPHGIMIEFDALKLNNDNFKIITQFPQIIEDSGEIGILEIDIFKVEIYSMDPLEYTLIDSNEHYFGKIRNLSKNDPYCLDELYSSFEKIKNQ